MKEFSTAIAVHEGVEEGEEFKFKVDDRILVAYGATPEQMAVVLSKIGRHTSLQTKIAGIIDFLMAVMDEEDAAWLSERLLDRRDPFGLPDVTSILMYLIEEWGGHPTQEPSGSSSTPSTSGPTSTPVEPTTPSTSPSTDS